MLDVSPAESSGNLKSNWPVLVSLPALYVTEISFTDVYADPVRTVFFYLLLAAACGVIGCACMPPWVRLHRRAPVSARAFSALTALGMAMARVMAAEASMLELAALVLGPAGLVLVSAFAAAGCFFILYLLCLFLLQRISDLLDRTGYRIGGPELAVIAAAVIACSVACAAFCSGTSMTYTLRPRYDAVYQFDSGSVIAGMSHARFSEPGNGVHQLLFAVFAVPFSGIPYLVSMLSGWSTAVFAVSEAAAQACAIAFGFSFLGHAMGLGRTARACWLAVCCSMFSYFLFSLCVEQYVAGFFYAALLVLALAGTGRPDKFSAYAAVGCAAPSAAMLAPAVFAAKPWRSGAGFLARRAAGIAVEVFVVTAACFRALLPQWVFRSSSAILRFTSVSERCYDPPEQLRQFASMAGSVFVAPPSGPVSISTVLDGKDAQYPDLAGLMIWDQVNDGPVPVFGILMLALAAAGLWACRNEAWAKAAGAHLAASFFMVAVLGMAASDGTPVLYALYMGWPVPCLAAGFLKRVFSGRGAEALLVSATVLACAAMLAYDVPVILDMFRFGAWQYPA